MAQRRKTKKTDRKLQSRIDFERAWKLIGSDWFDDEELAGLIVEVIRETREGKKQK